MKALVLGGNRYFGKRLVHLLLQRGEEVTLLNRGNIADDFGEQVQRVRMDRAKLDSKHPVLANGQWDIVYDQICYDAMEAKSACEFFAGKTSKYIFISSQSVYGPGENISEVAFDPLNYQFKTIVNRDQNYAEAKRQAETVFFREAKFAVTAVRLPIVLGPDDYTERLKLHTKWIQEKKPIFFPNIESKISFIHAKDAAAFLAAQLDKQALGPINCCAPSPIALKELIHEIERAVGKVAILANNAAAGEPSPFGIESDWYMMTRKMEEYGFAATPIEAWLPKLVHDLL